MKSPPQEMRHLRLIDAHQCRRVRLGESSSLDDIIDHRDELGLGQMLCRIRESDIREDIAAAACDAD